jgi:hypothetical protein
MATPNWHAVAPAGALSVGDITQFLGTHGCALLYQGTVQVSYGSATGTALATNTGAAPQWISQPFVTAAAQTTISRIELDTYKVGAGADTTIEIRTDNAGVPSNVTLFSIVLPADFQVNGTILSIPVNLTGLTAATKYHIVIDGTASTANYFTPAQGVTSVNAALISASGTGGWASGGCTLYFAVFAGVNGVLRNTYEDAGARWTTIDYTNSVAAGNTTPVHIGEYTVGSLRSWRTCTFTNGQLVSVA